MAEQFLISDKAEALDYLILEKGLTDARIPLETAFYGVKAWLTISECLPPSLDGGDSYWLFPDGEIVSTHIVGPSIKKEYERQVGQPFPPKRVED